MTETMDLKCYIPEHVNIIEQ